MGLKATLQLIVDDGCEHERGVITVQLATPSTHADRERLEAALRFAAEQAAIAFDVKSVFRLPVSFEETE